MTRIAACVRALALASLLVSSSTSFAAELKPGAKPVFPAPNQPAPASTPRESSPKPPQPTGAAPKPPSSAAASDKAVPPAPILTAVESTADGYALIGSNFGTNKDDVKVFEGAGAVEAKAVISLKPDRITVKSKPKGTVAHKVVLSGQSSATVEFNHTPAAASSQSPGATASMTKSLALGALTATGLRSDTAPVMTKSLALGALSATGPRSDAAPVMTKSLSLGALNATGPRE